MKTDHVQLKDIFARINALRIQEGHRPYASKKYVAKMLKKHGCKVMFKHFSCDLYNIKSALGIARKMMEKASPLQVRASWKNCYEVAPDNIDLSPDWATVGETAKRIGCKTNRLNIAIKYRSLYAYYSARRKKRIVNVEQAREWACWRSFQFLNKKLGVEKAREIQNDPATKSKVIVWADYPHNMYYCPEIIHL